MYFCNQCGSFFEKNASCPFCDSMDVRIADFTHCRCCGAKLKAEQTEYCSADCKKKGKILWERERRRKNLSLVSPLNLVLREIAEYNKEHNTKLSYGQYIALTKEKKK